MYVRRDVNSCARVTHESHKDWSPTKNADSTVCFRSFFIFFFSLTLTLNREVFTCNVPSYEMQIFVIARDCFDA